MTFASLLEKNTELESEVSSLNQSLEKAQTEEERLKLVIESLRHRLFGKSSERRASDDAQLNLFSLGESQTPEPKETIVPEHTRRPKKPIRDDEEEAPEGTFPAHLSRRDNLIDIKPEGVPDEDLEIIAEKVTERLGSIPEEHYVERTVRRTYKQKSTGMISTPRAPGHVFDHRCKVTESFLVMMAIKKFLWHLPLYRQERQLRMQGIEITRQSLASWTIKLGELFKPIAIEVANAIRESELIHGDETPFTVNRCTKKKGKKYQDGFLWPILNPDIGVAFIYGGSRKHAVIKDVLGDTRAVIVSDAYEAWENHVLANNLMWQLCWMHIRRKFIEAESSNPELAGEAIARIKKLYKIETEAAQLSIEKRTQYRMKYSKPVLEEFKQWLLELSATPAVLTDDLMAKAFNYVLSRWSAATLFVYDGAIPIDNGAVERAIRPVKIGAKNWLFAASEIGAEVVGVFYTLINSALMHGIHPYYYLMDLTKRIDDPRVSAADLVPHRWKETFFEYAVPEHLQTITRNSQNQ